MSFPERNAAQKRQAPASLDDVLLVAGQAGTNDLTWTRNDAEELDTFLLRRRYVPTHSSSVSTVASTPMDDPTEEPTSGPSSGSLALETEAGRAVLSVPPSTEPVRELELLQQWEGTVTTFDQADFAAVLRDLQDPSDPERVEAVFSRRDVANGDLPLLDVGAVFTWTIVRERSAEGQVRNVDFIRFQRLPAWTTRELERVDRRAAQLRSRFGEDSTHEQSSGS